MKASFSLTSHETVHFNHQTAVLKTAALGQCSNVFVIEMKWKRKIFCAIRDHCLAQNNIK